ncbi:MAG: HAMP domain-containing histidine kinase [Lachnospiraceae bacterium]|nr:HAMP domain-containing histidine kinase [Lachnospiraceae bacterium]
MKKILKWPSKWSLKIELSASNWFYLGLMLVVLGVAMPCYFTIDSFGVTKNLALALRLQDASYLLLAALRLAALNALRCYPHYLGAFMIGEAITIRIRGRTIRWPGALLVAGIIIAVYQIIDVVHHIHYDFGAPALILVTIQVALWGLAYTYVSPVRKMIMQILFITAFQFLDIMPALRNLPFGRGETSQNIKQAAAILGYDSFLDDMCLLFFVLFLVMGIIVFMLLRQENYLYEIAVLKDERAEAEQRAARQEQENRTYQEMQHLVHDLKSPLTSIQNLVGVMEIQCEEGNSCVKESEYLATIEKLVDNMSRTISEILYEQSVNLLPVSSVLRTIQSQASITPYAGLLLVRDEAPEAKVQVNRIRFARAVINLLDNAYASLPDGKGDLQLHVYRSRKDDVDLVAFTVKDNGCGIPPEALGEIWERGYSGRGSSGLGLPYVKKVVEASDGEILVTSHVGEGTVFTILLPEGVEEDET